MLNNVWKVEKHCSNNNNRTATAASTTTTTATAESTTTTETMDSTVWKPHNYLVPFTTITTQKNLNNNQVYISVLLSFENFCSRRMQEKMVKYLVEILGDQLLTEPLSNYPVKEY